MQSGHLPKHVLIIPDGNRRWAEEHGKSRSDGYLEGVRRFREISKTAFEMGILYFTFWAASASNLKRRNPAEVQVLVSLLRHELEKKSTLENCLKRKIRFRVIGNWFEASHGTCLLHAIQTLQDQTKIYGQYFLTILFGYSGVEEGEEGTKQVCKHPPKHFDGKALKRAVWTRDLPEVDLMIRTGTERQNWTHNSDGILNPWLAPNSRVFSPQVLWPDFTADDFRRTIIVFSEIPRRLGA